MRAAIYQPQYFPRLHYYNRILNSDIFIIRDDVQFVRKHKYPPGITGRSFQAQTIIKQAHGPQLLIVPIRHHGYQPIYKTQVSYCTPWPFAHANAIQVSYSKAPQFSSIFPEITQILSANYDNIAALNISTILWGILRLLGKTSIRRKDLTVSSINKKLQEQRIFRLSHIKLATQTKTANENNCKKNRSIIALCKELGATEYYCGGTAISTYINHDLFINNGIKISVQDWKCPEYPQRFMKEQGFIPNLSLIDLFMNVPEKKDIEILKDPQSKEDKRIFRFFTNVQLK